MSTIWPNCSASQRLSSELTTSMSAWIATSPGDLSKNPSGPNRNVIRRLATVPSFLR